MSCWRIAACQQRQVLDETLHRRVEAVALLELDGQALGKRAGEDAGRVEMLQPAQGRLDAGDGTAEQPGDGGKVGGEISGLVDEVDEMGGDQPVGGLLDLDRELRQEMLAQGLRPHQGLVEPRQVVPTARGAAAPGLGVAGVVEIAFALAAGHVVPETRWPRRASATAGGLGASAGVSSALEQRILLDLALDIGRELEIRQLQQLDRLLQLRRHHQRLGLPKIEPLGKRHGLGL